MAILTPTQRDRIVPRLIEDEMRASFIDYSMSVIVQRALPDVRDGLKPVHRRILFAMQEAGLVPTRPYKKCATVVGDVLGKYHPHGDASVYDALVRMVQDFSLRYPLVDGQGNFGSIDGDAAAAYRYTESRLSPIATEMLADIDKDTVDFAPNYDDRLQEPRVLPAAVPNLLVNGSSGIAVGMSTNVPPHNLAEVVRAAIHLLDHPECTTDDLMVHVPGPDFPTGGIIVGVQGIRDAYESGRGRVVMKARVYKESRRSGKEQLVVTEIPYGTNKSRILEQIADLTRAGKLQDVSDLRDESDRDGIRVVIELKRGADPAKVLQALYKGTALQTTFGVIALALDGGVPRELGLKTILERFRDHRLQVVVRRSRWELEKARDEAHVLEGLTIALRKIEQVIAIIRGSRNRESASNKLQKELKLTERQAEAILNMRLSRLTQLEVRELRDRLEELGKRIAELETLLASPERQTALIRRELAELAEKYGDPRRTTIYESEKSVRIQDMIAAEEVVVTVTREGYAKQVPMQVYQRAVGRGGSLIGTDYEADYLERVLVASTEDWLMAFTADGRAYGLPVRDLPDTGLSSRGKRLHQLLELPRNANVATVLLVSEFSETRAVLFATAGGTVKRTSLDQFTRPRSGGVEAISLRSGDVLSFVAVTDGEMEVVLAASGGRTIRFGEGDVPLMGRATQGVRGMKLDGKERIVGLIAARADTELCAVTGRGLAKRFAMDELPLQKRDGKGTILVPAGKDVGEVVAVLPLGAADLAAVTQADVMMRIRRAAIPQLPRDARPEPVLELARSERVVAVTPLAERDATAPVTTADELLEEPSTNAAPSDGTSPGAVTADADSSAPSESADGASVDGDASDGSTSDASASTEAPTDTIADADADADTDAEPSGDGGSPAAVVVEASVEEGELFEDTASADDLSDAIIEEPIVPEPRRRRTRAAAPDPEPEPEPEVEPAREPAEEPAPTAKRGRKAPKPEPELVVEPAPEPEPIEEPASEPAPVAKRGRKAPAAAVEPEPTPEPEPEPPAPKRRAKASAPPPEPEPPATEAGKRGKKPDDEVELDLFG
ncbi:DNA gyrase subunit A [Longimicrobium sp.]|uniref:DNA gyrase subunit A n=1 Tax=Longimicrobium sp. TaxID=2029185 RepID=UPI002E365EE7|nr:DNA gyrase subunit A [Longimicrobium sp.]HEX6042496.1 DNA gyrase subunit A [Longimicrobium sp.]